MTEGNRSGHLHVYKIMLIFFSVSMSTVGDNILDKALPKVSN